MITCLIIFGIVWGIGALAGACALLDQGVTKPESFAIAVFWPLFLVLFLIKGLFKALWHFND